MTAPDHARIAGITGLALRFTRLRLNGFKSFVDPTDLVISDGLTGVVGPNGCGKSNLLEALRWVMGENRASAMRGDGMEDVIFAGAATRPARNFAEVALTLDNSDRLAPSGFNDADGIDIVRRITRDAGSVYRVNTKEVRARDVQMLFADASTGAHSPALVRQGQIAELINAKPRNRRRILEEAAGISGLYQRRHDAELKLTAAEANLLRVADVIEQMAAQLHQLARQVRQAMRYREIGEDLRRAEGVLLYRRWREADAACAAAAADLRGCMQQAATAEAGARAAAKARAAQEDALPPLREEEAIAGAVLQRLMVQRDTLQDAETRAQGVIAALTARIAQLAQDGEREAGLNRDADETMARLDWEQAALGRAAEGHDARFAVAGEAARAAASVLQADEAALSQATEDGARLAARHQSAQRLLAECRATLTKAVAETARAGQTATDAGAALLRATADHDIATQALGAAQGTAEASEAVLVSTETARAQTEAREAGARAARSAAEGEANALRAELGALARIVQREAGAGGQVLDALTVEPGFERALGAALADDLRAPQAGPDAASGWVMLPKYRGVIALPDGATPLGDHVQVPPVLARRIGLIGLVAADDGARLQAALLPGQRLVSREGDLWRWDGFRAGAQDAPSAAALRLQHVNRLTVLKRDLEEVGARADGARQAHDVLTARLAELSRADQMARDARRDADRRLTEAHRAVSRAEAEQSIAAARRDAALLAETRFAEDTAVAQAAFTAAETAVQSLGDLDATRAAGDDSRRRVDASRAEMLARRAAQDDLRREGEARNRRSQEVVREIAGWRTRLATAQQRIAELTDRRAAAEADLQTAAAVPQDLAARRADLAEAIAAAEARRRAAADATAAAQAALRTAPATERDRERAASEAREARARAEARAEAAGASLTLATDRIRDEAETTPAALLEGLALDPDTMPAADAAEADVGRLKRQREALGAVNLRAEEDTAALLVEHDGLGAEKTELDEAIRKLRGGIAGLNREGRERLLTAFEQVNANFAMLFTHLFGGGEARLMLVESDDPLEAGLELMCQPPGKKLSTLSLLSGGEQTLTAMALIFGVFLANPAPICVLDEVDAPLDDANVTRFCDLLDEMARQTETRFLVITHHAVTMSRMSRLYGVTMAEQGVSQLVSVDLTRAASLVA